MARIRAPIMYLGLKYDFDCLIYVSAVRAPVVTMVCTCGLNPPGDAFRLLRLSGGAGGGKEGKVCVCCPTPEA